MYYRLYLLTDKAHIASFEEFDACDDDDAIQKADAYTSPRKELWCERRRVKQWMLQTE